MASAEEWTEEELLRHDNEQVKAANRAKRERQNEWRRKRTRENNMNLLSPADEAVFLARLRALQEEEPVEPPAKRRKRDKKKQPTTVEPSAEATAQPDSGASATLQPSVTAGAVTAGAAAGAFVDSSSGTCSLCTL